MAYVKNLIGTTNNPPPKGFSSWKEWWEYKKKRSFNKCSNNSCSANAILGAHVKEVYGSYEWYIIPLCDSCNKKTDNFYINNNDLQPVNS